MSGFANPYRRAWLADLILGTSTAPSSSVLYVSLLTTLPSSDGTTTLYPTDHVEWGVVRRSISGLPSTADVQVSQPVVGGGGVQFSNLTALSWTAAEIGASLGSSVTVLGWGIFSALSGGNLIAWDDLLNPASISPSNPYTVPAGEMIVRMRGFA